MAASVTVEVLRQVTDAAAAIYTAPPRRHAALAYLTQRGIDARNLPEAWSIGYAPPGWTRLVDQLRDSFSEQALIDAGVARHSSRGSLIDAFRDRVLFGIRTADGTLAGFTGRDLSGDPGAPKYLNNHHSDVFDKSTLLYGLHEGLRGGGKKQPVLVEGPLDVLAITARQQTDGTDTLLPVAPCGTALTLTQARGIAGLAHGHPSQVVVAMDADPAGREAALDAGERLRFAVADVRVASLPTGSDPAAYLARSAGTLDTFRFEAGLPLITLRVQNAIAVQGDRMQWIEGRLAALRDISTYLATYPVNHAARQIGWIADALRLDASTVTTELSAAFGRGNVERAARTTTRPFTPVASRVIEGIA